MPLYEYQDLKDPKAIRILTLHPGSDEIPRATLSIRKPNEEYEALSWHWGDEDESETIQIKDDRGWSSLHIKPNLSVALKQLRHDSITFRKLWIDAICMNQKSKTEKNAQVPMMAQIYSEATNVCVWLGEEEVGSATALKFIKEKVLDLGAFDDLVDDPDTPPEWAALSALMSRPWFSRRWVVQEIALAKDATLHCGKDEISWSQFAVAVALFERRSKRLSKLVRGEAKLGYHPDYFGDVHAMGASRLVHTTSSMYRRSDDGTILERLLSLEELVAILSDFNCRIPHDVFYAVLALGKDTFNRSRTRPMAEQNQSSNGKDATDGTKTQPSSDMPPPALATNGGDEETISRLGPKTARQANSGSPTTRLPQKRIQRSNAQSPPSKRSKSGRTTATTNGSRQPSSDVLRGTDSQPHIPSSSHTEANDGSQPGGAADSDLAYKTDALVGKEMALKQRVINQLKKAKDPENSMIFQVDYEASFFEVCKHFMKFAISKSDSLDLLCRPWAPEGLNLPSWIPDLSGAVFGSKSDRRAAGKRKMTRRNADPLVGQAGLQNRNYSAARHTTASEALRFGDGVNGHERCMFVKGFVLDTVAIVEDSALMGNIPAKWLNLGWPNRTKESPERFWRTLVADRAPDGLNVPVYYPLAWQYAVSQSDQGAGINTLDLIQNSNCSILAEFLRRVQSVIWDKKLIKTKPAKVDSGTGEQQDLLGLAPKSVQIGDCMSYHR
jgi:hypothetical protein